MRSNTRPILITVAAPTPSARGRPRQVRVDVWRATVRAAAGARIGSHVAVEIGVGLDLLGGVYNSAELQSMSSYDPRGNAPLPPPDRAVSGGTQTGVIDGSVGFVL